MYYNEWYCTWTRGEEDVQEGAMPLDSSPSCQRGTTGGWLPTEANNALDDAQRMKQTEADCNAEVTTPTRDYC